MSNFLRNASRAAALAVLGLGAIGLPGAAHADSSSHVPVNTGGAWTLEDGELKAAPRVDDHGPIGVMGDHRHKPGQLMLSYRFMRMWMEDNLIGEDEVSPAGIAANVPNIFFGNAPYIEKSMEHLTFLGPRERRCAAPSPPPPTASATYPAPP